MRILILCSLVYAGYWFCEPVSKESVESQPSIRPASPSPESTPSAGELKQPHSRVLVNEIEPLMSQDMLVAVIDQSSSPPSESVSQSVAPDNLTEIKNRLRRSLEIVAAVPAYTATLEQQVEKNGRLLDPEWIDLKMRRSPFSVFLKWQNDGQEALYLSGQNNGRVLVHPTRGLASLRRVWKLSPESAQAMKSCRYPITEIGIENLCRIALNFYQRDALNSHNTVCVESHGLANGRPAILYDISFADDQVSPEYSTSRLTFDEETKLLVSVENHGWGPDGRPGSLLELYRYHAFRPAPQLTDEDFSIQNPAYHFVK